MSTWLVVLLSISGGLTAIGVVWNKVLKPLLGFIQTISDLVPILSDLAKEFKDAPGAFAVLVDIQAQFRSDSGSTLKDSLNRLEATTIKTQAATDALQIQAEAQKQLIALVHEQQQTLLVQLDRVSVKGDDRAVATEALKEATVGIAADLAAVKETVAEKK